MTFDRLWPESAQAISATKLQQLERELLPGFIGQLKNHQLPLSMSKDLSRFYLPLAAWLNAKKRSQSPVLVGLNGAQGSGKSTLCTLLQWLLNNAFDCRCALLSIDDLYLPQSDRLQLAKDIHPLLATRGVPGTHDIPLGLSLLERLRQNEIDSRVELPRFNKAEDDRRPTQDWEQIELPVDLVLFEGWCVGAPAQSDQELQPPINRLEEKEDPEARWRTYVNNQLRGPYVELFEQMDLLLMLQIPDWELVYSWRKRQEQQLAARQSGAGVMGETKLRRFIQHYERLTRHQLSQLPERADLVMKLDARQCITEIHSAG